MAGARIARKVIEGLRVRKLDGKVVKPVLYNGRAIGHGKYFAASIDNEMLLDDSGKPLQFRSVGAVEDV